ncbi:MAG: carboxymuconolactone decarboxylase [Hyphomicrobiales bacterium]|jgi:AhpD family alkylhydroperoxidase|nr:carboxymuconolactone decarboxylase [Hyphomicrobiales bacterium]
MKKEAGLVDDWKEFTTDLNASLRKLRADAPDVMKSFSALAQAAMAGDGLDAKTKELIALAISVAVRCDDCIGFHVKAAAHAGATRQQLSETLGMAIYMGAGPSVMYANHALAAFDQFTQDKT